VHTDATDLARTEGILVLARHGRVTPEEAGQFIGKLLGGTVTFGDLTSRLSPATLRREAFEAYAAADPQLWSDSVIGDLPRLPPGLLDSVADRLVAEGRGAALANRMAIFLMTPSRQPATVIRLAKRFAGGLFDDVEGAPGVVDVFMGLLHLAETQAPRAERGDKEAKDAVKGIEDLLAARRGALVSSFAETSKRAEMERAMGVLARCKAIPDGISGRLAEACHQRFPDLVPRDETPFWESTNIFSSRAGLARRQEEYRVLIEEQIPENSESIGRAASYGDLSENYEWTAAIEQQRQLTEKAAAMEAELKLARAIEDQVVEEEVVCPGCRVTYEEDGESKTITILGPWDSGEGVVSYRAPVASGMLGARAGDPATLELPDGSIEVVVRSLERVL